MSAAGGPEQSLPQVRTNKHFRIKSASKEKMLLGGDLLTTRSKRKNSIDDAKRIFSEHRNKKSGSIDSALKIRITKDQLAARFEKKPKKIAYEAVKTDVDPPQEIYTPQLHTITHDFHIKTLQRIPDIIKQVAHLQPRAASKQPLEGMTRKDRLGASGGEKGKYRCRVNQFIFDHSRKKSSHCSKEQQQAMDAFWSHVNESMILGREGEEISQDLREFVEHFPTE